MHESKRTYCPGLEFYSSPDMGLCGIENDKNGTQRTYQYLVPDEATEWMAAWLDGREWSRPPRFERERSHA